MIKKILLICSFGMISLFAAQVEGKEYFKDVVIKDCKKTETNIECSKFNRKGIQSEFITYDIKGIKKNGPYIKYEDKYAFSMNCVNNCLDKKIVKESGQYKMNIKVGVWFLYNEDGEIIKKDNYDRSSFKDKMNKEKRYVPLVQYSGTSYDKAMNNQ